MRFRCHLTWCLLLFVAAAVGAGTLEVPVEPTAEGAAAPPTEGSLSMDLSDALAMALQRNLDLQVGRLEIVADSQGVLAANGIFDPMLTLNLSTDSTEQPTATALEGTQSKNTTFGFGYDQLLPIGTKLSVQPGFRRTETDSPWALLNPYWGGDLSFSLTQPLLEGFGSLVNRSGIVIAHNRREQSLASFETQVIATVQSVETAYWNLIAARESVLVEQESLELAQRLLDETHERVKVGTSAPIDLVQSEAGVATRRQALIYAENAAANSEDELKAMLGFDQPAEWMTSIEASESYETATISPDLASSIEQALDQRPEVLQQLLVIDYLELQAKLAQDTTRPTLDLNASYGYTGVAGRQLCTDETTGVVSVCADDGLGETLNQITGGDFPHWEVGVTLRMPFGNNEAKSSLAQARFGVQQGQVQLAALKQQVIKEVRTAVRSLDDGAAAVEAAVASRELAERNLEAEQTKFANGLSTNYLVLDIQENLAQARLAELRARIDYRKAMLLYRVATGTLLEAQNIRIADPSSLDEPHTWFNNVRWLRLGELKNSK